MPKVYCSWLDCDHNRHGRCKARSISMEDHYRTPTCDSFAGEWLEPRPIRECDAKRVSDKIMKAMLERMNAQLKGADE